MSLNVLTGCLLGRMSAEADRLGHTQSVVYVTTCHRRRLFSTCLRIQYTQSSTSYLCWARVLFSPRHGSMSPDPAPRMYVLWCLLNKFRVIVYSDWTSVFICHRCCTHHWRCGLAVAVGLDQQIHSVSGPISTGMGDCLFGIPPQYLNQSPRPTTIMALCSVAGHIKQC